MGCSSLGSAGTSPTQNGNTHQKTPNTLWNLQSNKFSCLCVTTLISTYFFFPHPSRTPSVIKKREKDLSLLPFSGYKEGNDINNIKDNSLGFVSKFMACQKQGREYSAACIHEYLIMQLCAINFNQRKVMYWAHERMVKCGRIKCMGIHSLPRNVTQQEMA